MKKANELRVTIQAKKDGLENLQAASADILRETVYRKRQRVFSDLQKRRCSNETAKNPKPLNFPAI